MTAPSAHTTSEAHLIEDPLSIREGQITFVTGTTARNGDDISPVNSMNKKDYPVMSTIGYVDTNTNTDDEKDASKTLPIDLQMTIYEAFKRDPTASFWCCFMLFTSIGWGYDNYVGGAVTGTVTWRRDFGEVYDDEYIIPITWQYAYNAGGSCAMFVAALLTGPLLQRFGSRISLLLASLIWLVGAVVQYQAKSIGIYTTGKILTSLVQGMYLTISPAYVSEIAPTKIRGMFLSSTNFFIVIGQFMGALVQRASDEYAPSKNSYLILFAIQWLFGGLIFIIAIVLPESPDWCLRRMRRTGNQDETRVRACINALYGNQDGRVDFELARFRSSLLHEEQLLIRLGRVSYTDLVKGVDLRRTIISIAPPIIQVLCGAGFFIGYSTYFLQLIGIASTESYTVTMAQYGISLVGSLLGFFGIDKLGRRPLFLGGCLALCSASFSIAIIGEINTLAANWVILVLVSLWAFIYQATLGPVGWAISSESSSRRLRGKTVSLVTSTNAFCNLIFYFINPAILNPDRGNLGTRAGFIYGTLMILCSAYAYLCIPELTARSFEEADELFALRIPARQFRLHKTSYQLKAEPHTVL